MRHSLTRAGAWPRRARRYHVGPIGLNVIYAMEPIAMTIVAMSAQRVSQSCGRALTAGAAKVMAVLCLVAMILPFPLTVMVAVYVLYRPRARRPRCAAMPPATRDPPPAPPLTT